MHAARFFVFEIGPLPGFFNSSNFICFHFASPFCARKSGLAEGRSFLVGGSFIQIRAKHAFRFTKQIPCDSVMSFVCKENRRLRQLASPFAPVISLLVNFITAGCPVDWNAGPHAHLWRVRTVLCDIAVGYGRF